MDQFVYEAFCSVVRFGCSFVDVSFDKAGERMRKPFVKVSLQIRADIDVARNRHQRTPISGLLPESSGPMEKLPWSQPKSLCEAALSDIEVFWELNIPSIHMIFCPQAIRRAP